MNRTNFVFLLLHLCDLQRGGHPQAKWIYALTIRILVSCILLQTLLSVQYFNLLKKLDMKHCSLTIIYHIVYMTRTTRTTWTWDLAVSSCPGTSWEFPWCP